MQGFVAVQDQAFFDAANILSVCCLCQLHALPLVSEIWHNVGSCTSSCLAALSSPTYTTIARSPIHTHTTLVLGACALDPLLRASVRPLDQ